VRVIVWVLLGTLALCVLPMAALVIAGLVRRFQIARTEHELTRMGFVGSAPAAAETRSVWTLVGTGLVGLVALIVATLVLPGPPAGRLLAATDGSSLAAAPTHSSVVASGTDPGTGHSSSGEPATGHGAASSPASHATSVSPTAGSGSEKGAPASVTAHPSATAIRVQWAPVTGAASYHVERSTDTVKWNTIAMTGGAQTAYTDDAVSSGTTYYYRVAAIVEGADVARSDVVSATPTVDTPAAPVLISATGSATSVGLAWSDVEGDLGYQIQRSLDGTTDWGDIGTTDPGVTSYTDTGLLPSTTYYYRVITMTDGGSSAPSNALPATTGPGDSSSGPSTSDANAAPSLAPAGP